MKQDFSITRKFWNGVRIEIRFERYLIQFDDGQWKSIVEIEALLAKQFPASANPSKKLSSMPTKSMPLTAWQNSPLIT